MCHFNKTWGGAYDGLLHRRDPRHLKGVFLDIQGYDLFTVVTLWVPQALQN